MYIAIDETGSFREGKDLEYGIVTLVTITDNEWNKLQSLLNQLFPVGWTNIKGKIIDDKKREILLKYIGKKHEIKYTAMIYDLTFGADEWVNHHRNAQVEKINVAIESIRTSNGNSNLITQLELMARRLKGMAEADYAKFILIYDLYREWLQYYQFDFVYIHPDNDS